MTAFFKLSSKVNAIYPTLAKELALPIKPTEVGAQKILGTILNTFEIVVAAFSMANKANRVWFFEETFWMANISLKVVFGMLFLTLSGADVNFLSRELRWRIYTTKKAFLTTRCVELVGKKEFAATALDPKYETYVVYVRSVSSIALPISSPLDMYLCRRP